ISTGASARATDERSSSTSRRVRSGVSTLRPNRMKPSGSASRKKARSSAVRSGPAQLKMTARGTGMATIPPPSYGGGGAGGGGWGAGGGEGGEGPKRESSRNHDLDSSDTSTAAFPLRPCWPPPP